MPGAQVGEGVAFPWLVLASVDGEFSDGSSLGHGAGEPAARGDLGELVGIAGEDHPPTGGQGPRHGGFEVPGSRHARLVDHQDRGGGGLVDTAVPAADQAVDGHRLDPCTDLEFQRGPS